MSTADRIMNMHAAGTISSQEKDELLGALPGAQHKSWRDWLVNPMRRMTDGRAVALIAFVTVAQLAIGFAQPIRFDGALDMHVVKDLAAPALIVREWMLSLPFLSLVFFAAARVFGGSMRVLDAFTITALGRFATIAMAVIAAVTLAPLVQTGAQLGALQIAASIAMLPLVVIELVWMFHGFKTAANLRGAKLWGAFLGAIVVAEVLSKLALLV